MTTLALLPQLLAMQPALAEARRRVEAEYRDNLKDHESILLALAPEACISGSLRLPVRLCTEQGQRLSRFGVARSYPRTLADYPEVASWLEAESPIPGSRELASQLHTLPTHGLLVRSDRMELLGELIRIVDQ